ncbi:hypothetical protein LCGC14_0798720 [marine sediment metagenome]|uniref:Uncharacterized protein n=1 Tax=marine sediment metagenome TaxID=412755 RepID=A0A0F9PUT6_9ZZZZ
MDGRDTGESPPGGAPKVDLGTYAVNGTPPPGEAPTNEAGCDITEGIHGGTCALCLKARIAWMEHNLDAMEQHVEAFRKRVFEQGQRIVELERNDKRQRRHVDQADKMWCKALDGWEKAEYWAHRWKALAKWQHGRERDARTSSRAFEDDE